MADERAVDEQYLASLERRLAALKQGPKGTKAAKKQFLSDLASRKDFELFRLLTSEPGAGTSLDSERPDSDPFAEFDRPIDANYIQRKVAPQTVAVNQQEKLRLLISDLLDIQCQEADGEDAQVLQILAKESLELKAQSETKVIFCLPLRTNCKIHRKERRKSNHRRNSRMSSCWRENSAHFIPVQDPIGDVQVVRFGADVGDPSSSSSSSVLLVLSRDGQLVVSFEDPKPAAGTSGYHLQRLDLSVHRHTASIDVPSSASYFSASHDRKPTPTGQSSAAGMRTTARLSQMSGGTASGVISSSSSPSTHTAQCPNPRTLWLTAARQLQLVEPKPEITAWTLAATASRRATFVILSWVWMNAATAQPLAATFDVLLLTRPNEMGRRVKLESVASGKLASPATLIHVGKPNHSHAEGDGDQDVVDFTFFPAAAAPASFSLREATGWTLTERSGTPWMSAYPIPQGRLDPKPCILKVQEVTLPNARLTFMATMAGRLECVALENGKPGFSGGGGAGKILCRHAIKLMAPISALHILDVTASPELECWQVRLLVSSTLGPPVVWFAIFSSNSANQHHSIVWTLYVMLLLRPESDDAPLCTSIVDMPDKLVAVGTYAGKVKFYSTQEVTADATVPPVAGLELTCQSPVRSLHFEPKSSEKLRILSTDGLHTFELVK